MDTATTEINPYGPPLSLPHALPISAISDGDARAEQPRRTGAPPGVAIDDALGFPAFGMRHQLARDELGRFVGEHLELVVHPWRTLHIESFNLRDSRSEEPTSELKTLMRTSYAVFC